MAETNPNADVNIKVGAEANIDGATSSILSEFDAMEERLRRIGTEEAKALAKQLQSVTKGLGKGAFKAEDVEELAQRFAAIAKDSEISDNAIRDLSTSLSNAVGRSRQLSDYMERTKDGATKAERAVNAASKFLDSKMSPATRKISDTVGGLAGKIPGVQSMLLKMPALAGGIGVAFKAALVVAEKLVALNKEFRAGVREWGDRNLGIKAETAANDYANRIAQLDLEDRKRKEALADTKAMAEAELELENLRKQKELSERMQNTPYARERGFLELNEQRAAQRRTMDRRGESIEEDIAESQSERSSLEKRKETLSKRIDEEQAILDKMFSNATEAEGFRSALSELEEYEAKGVKGDMLDKVKARLTDSVNGILSGLGINNMAPEEAEQRRKDFIDKARQQSQNIKQMKQQRQGIDLDLDANKRKQDALEMQRKLNEASKAATEEKWRAEEAARKQEIEESLAGKRAELMSQGNRLTAMGLGGGNVGVDYGKDIAGNTKEMLAIMKENLKGFNRRGIAGDNKLNGPNIAPQSSLGDWGKMGWGM